MLSIPIFRTRRFSPNLSLRVCPSDGYGVEGLHPVCQGTIGHPFQFEVEDSHYQPLLGYTRPYDSLTDNVDQMLRLLGKAIKSVYASVFFAASRAYIAATGNVLSEEKMAVIIQEICGTEDQGYFSRRLREWPVRSISIPLATNVRRMAWSIWPSVWENWWSREDRPSASRRSIRKTCCNFRLRVGSA